MTRTLWVVIPDPAWSLGLLGSGFTNVRLHFGKMTTDPNSIYGFGLGFGGLRV